MAADLCCRRGIHPALQAQSIEAARRRLGGLSSGGEVDRFVTPRAVRPDFRGAGVLVRFFERVEGFAQRRVGKGWGGDSYDLEARVSLRGVGDGCVVVDAGGNLGHWSAAALGHVKPSRLLIIEPDPGNAAALRSRFPAEPVEVIEAALSTGPGTAKLYTDTPGSGLASLHQRNLDHQGREHRAIAEVRTIDLRTMLDERAIETVDLLKMDIEGHEYAVLAQAADVLLRIRRIQFEFGGSNIASRTYFSDFWHLLSPAYSLLRISQFGLIPITAYTEFLEVFHATNYLAVRKDAQPVRLC